MARYGERARAGRLQRDHPRDRAGSRTKACGRSPEEHPVVVRPPRILRRRVDPRLRANVRARGPRRRRTLADERRPLDRSDPEATWRRGLRGRRPRTPLAVAPAPPRDALGSRASEADQHARADVDADAYRTT